MSDTFLKDMTVMQAYAKNAYDMSVNTLHQANKTDQKTDTNSSDITDVQEAVAETFEITDTNSSDITDIQLAIAELYEIMEG